MPPTEAFAVRRRMPGLHQTAGLATVASMAVTQCLQQRTEAPP